MTAARSIKVLHVTFNMAIGGTEQVIRQLVTGTGPLGIENEILCIDGEVGDIGKLLQQDQGIRITAIRRRPGFDMELVKAIRFHIRRNSIDIVHCHQYTPYLYGFLGALGTRAKVVFTEHGRFYPDRYRYKAVPVNPLIALLTPAIVAISAATRDALARYEFMPRWKIQVIYNGIQGLQRNQEQVAQLRQALGIPSDGFIVGTVSRLDPVKNQPMMLLAFRRFLSQCPQAWLVMVGDGPDRAKLEALARELQIERRVIFTGFKTKPVDYLALLDIFLLSSLTEGTSMTLLEAMSLGIPAVATEVGGNPEIVMDGVTGLLSPSEDDAKFAQNMLRIWQDEDLRQAMSVAASRLFQERFSVQMMVKQYMKVYEGLLA